MLLVIAKLRVKCGRLTIYATTTTATYEATSADASVAAYVGFVFFGRFIAVAIIGSGRAFAHPVADLVFGLVVRE